MFSKFLSIARKGINFGGYGGNYGVYGAQDFWGGVGRRLPGSEFDYRREAGNPWENGIVAACVNWAIRVFPEAKRVVEEKQSNGTWEPLEWHPFYDLWEFPNKYYDKSLLLSGLILSRMVDGNSYWYLEMSKLGFPSSIYYLPHFTVWPQWDAEGKQYITSYAYRPLGASNYTIYPVEQIFHSRFGVNPLDIRKGMSPLYSLLREVCTDNEAATAAAALMRNMGMGGIVFSPDGDVADYDESQIDKLRRLGQEKFTGENRGKFFVSSVPGKFSQMGFNPEQMAFDKVRRLPEERICGAFGIPAIVAGMGAGLERSTFSNYEESRKAAYESCMCPMWTSLGEEMTLQFLPLYGDDVEKRRIRFDYSRVAALQENRDDLVTRTSVLWRDEAIDLAEYRSMLGLVVEDWMKGTYFEGNDQTGAEKDPAIDAGKPLDQKPSKRPGKTKLKNAS